MIIAPSLDFRKEAFAPVIDKKFRGVRIGWSVPAPAPSGYPALRLAIVYLIDDAQVEALGGKLPAEALVLMATSGLGVFAENILGDAMVFEDDYKRRDGLWLGYANLRLADRFRLHPTRGYYFTVSLGSALSNTLHLAETHA